LLTAGEWNIAMAICYEIVFQDVIAKQLPGADVLVTISNDAWFGDSLGSYQHLEIARMRALENGIPIIRASNDGISALIDHKGNVIGKMGKYEKGLLSGELSAVKGTTLYRTLGPSWSYFLILLIPGLILLFAYRSHTD
jgi:apolipoprotein N-acyltransferase